MVPTPKAASFAFVAGKMDLQGLVKHGSRRQIADSGLIGAAQGQKSLA